MSQTDTRPGFKLPWTAERKLKAAGKTAAKAE